MQKKTFITIQPWIGQILQEIKKDIKTEHLPADKHFYKEHFGSRPLNRLTSEEINAVYEKELLAGNENLSEWVVNRWVFKHGDIYQFFAEELSKINPNFQEIELIPDADAESMLARAKSFGAQSIYLFAELNEVVFSQKFFEQLRLAAEEERKDLREQEEKKGAQESLEQLLERTKREMARLQERYETKLAGVQRKYQTDVDALKKQIRSLQQKLPSGQ